MRRNSRRSHYVWIPLWLAILPVLCFCQGTQADYERADSYAQKLPELVYGEEVRPNWIEKTNRFWYRVHTRAGDRFLLVDAERKSKVPVFDHDKLADELSKASGKEVRASDLPFSIIKFVQDGQAIEFETLGFRWSYQLKTNAISKGENVEDTRSPRRSQEVMSPDRKWLAYIKDYNLFIRSTETAEEFMLSTDGTRENYYGSAGYIYYEPITWAPNSKKIAIFQWKRGLESTVYLIESSPQDQFQAKMTSRTYQFPGDVLDVPRLCVFSVDNKSPVKVNLSLNPAPSGVSPPVWSEDSRNLVISYQERGEQLTRAYAIDASSGRVRTILEETAETFIDRFNAIMEYASTNGELIWSSERDGWRHLYLYDVRESKLKNQITRGQWVVRRIDHVDEKARQVYFQTGGKNPGEDPYNVHGYRINFDSTGLIDLTPEQGNHILSYSPDFTFFVDTYSMINKPPVSVLKKASDGTVVMELEHADISELMKTDWKLPEPFVAKGRDGKTDIYGVIFRPMNFDPVKSYPVIEYIYAGPHGSHVPKGFRSNHRGHALTELGFIVVQIDGMGTANRSKAFHDICWKNLADAGFPDRILWIKAAAQKYPYMDVERVGIYGASAGGQNSTGALLFHPDFYKVAVSSCGCHDNRMDKAFWNEQWMGYPVGPHYEEQSNATNAHKLRGKLLLLVGELDTNVPPESTMRVVDALIKAEKDFELIVLPGQNHTSGGKYGERRRRDFFVRHLLGTQPPDWNLIEKKKEPT